MLGSIRARDVPVSESLMPDPRLIYRVGASGPDYLDALCVAATIALVLAMMCGAMLVG